jgi:hypothetical protein
MAASFHKWHASGALTPSARFTRTFRERSRTRPSFVVAAGFGLPWPGALRHEVSLDRSPISRIVWFEDADTMTRRFSYLLAIVAVGSACATTFRRHADRPLALVNARPLPLYPTLLRGANVEGVVFLRVAVDSLGRTQPGHMRVLRSTHELFSAALKQALGQWHFRATRRHGVPVADSLEVHATFEFDKHIRCPHRNNPCGISTVPIPAALMTLERDSLPRYLVIRVRSCPVVPLVACVSSGGAAAL